MLKKIDSKNMGRANHGWLDSIFHFSFSNYYNPENIDFGVLRVLNDDLIKPETGFDMHPHKDMAIISYVIEGELTHEDSMGNKGTITRGNVQYMSAGKGVYHSEHNLGKGTLRLLQIWIKPDRSGHEPTYGDYEFPWEERKHKWLHIVSNQTGEGPIKINQDVNFYALELEKDAQIDFPVDIERQAYLVQIEGSSKINNINLNERDAMEIVEENIRIKAQERSHFLLIEMKK